MKTIVLKPVLALLTACAVFSACSNDKQDVYNNADNGITYLPLPEEMHIHPLGDVINVSYTSDEDWKVRFSDSSQDWVSMTGSGRAGTSKLSISVSPNVQSDNDRDLTISFCSTDGKVVYDEFTIFQNVAILEVNRDSVDLGWKKPENNEAFKVTSNIQWRMTLEDPDSNFAENTKKVGKLCGKLDAQFYQSDEDVKFTPVENNLDSADRHAVFTITPVKLDKDGNEVQLVDSDLVKLTKTVSVSQDYLLFLLNDKMEDITLSGFSELGKDYVEANPDSINPEEHVLTKEFSITSEEKVTYDEDALAKIGGELVEGNHTEVELSDDRTVTTTEYTLYMTKPNPKTVDLDYALKFWAVEDTDAFRTVNVKQKPYVFNLETQTEDTLSTYINKGEEGKTLTVNTTGPWKLDTANEEWAEWLTIEPISGIDTTELTVTSKGRNLEFEDLKQLLQFSSKLHGDGTGFESIEDTVTARQEKFQFDVIPAEKLRASLSRANKNTHSISVTSSGEWAYKLKYYDVDKDWLNTKISIQGDTLYVTPSMNETVYQRNVEVEIWSVLHQDAVEKEGKQFKEDDWKKKCPIKQDALLFELKDLDDEEIFKPENFAAYGSKPQGIFFKCSAKWDIIYEHEADTAWLKFLATDNNKAIWKEDYYDYTTIQMIAETNKGAQIREAKVSVVADIDEDGEYGEYDEYEIPLTVTQDGFEFDVIVDEKSFSNSFGALNGTYKTQSIPVTAKITKGAEGLIKIDYNKEEDKWVDYTFGVPFDDENNDNLTLVPIILTPVDNPTKDVRKAILSIGNEVSPEIKTLPTITQDGYKFGGLINTTRHTFEALAAANENAEELDLECTPGAKWIVKSKPDWVEVRDENDNSITENVQSQSIKSTKIKIYSVKDNLNTASDQSYEVVTIKSVLGVYEKELKVKRKPYEWNVDSDDFIFNPVNNTEQKINIKSSGGWTRSVTVTGAGADAVVFATATEDDGSGYMIVSVDDNYTDTDRTNTITINSNQYDSEDVYGKLLTEDVTITQKKYVYDVKKLDNYKDNNGNIPFSADGGSKDIKGLSCSGDLVVADDGGKDWMRVEFNQGTLIITVDANKETEERSAEIIIQSEHYKSGDTHRENYQTKFKVTQKGAPKPEEEK